MAGSFRIAFVGGGPFVASLAHGIAAVAAAVPGLAVELALADADAARAARTAQYVGMLGQSRQVALTAVALPRESALDGAGLVFCAPDPLQAALRLQRLCAGVGWTPPAQGPGAVAAAAAVGPAVLEVAREVVARCPGALLVILADPADVCAGAARRRFGIAGLRAVGLSGDIDDLRGALAHLLGVAEDEVLLVHGGVGHVGWVVRFAVGGRDGYGEMEERVADLLRAGAVRPGDRVIAELYALTGMLRSSRREVWPFVLGPPGGLPEAGPPEAPQGREDALAQAVRARRPLAEGAGAHPDDSPLAWPGCGRSMGRLVRAVATGEPALVALQVPYAGDVLGWSPEVTVEVPVVAAGDEIEPVAVGPLPAGVDGLPRLLGQQRALAADYLAHPDLPLLRRALAATPEWGRVEHMGALSAAVHAEFGAELEAAVRS